MSYRKSGHAECVIFIVLALAISSITIAQLQPPSPSPEKGTKDNKTQTENKNRQPAQDLRSTASTPIIVDVLRPKKSAEEAAQERTERENKATEARFSFWFNFFLVLFNGILAVSTILLWFVTRKAANAARESANAAVNASMPYLSPRIASRLLTPNIELIPENTTHDPVLYFVFENHGKSPAIIRGVFAGLYLSELGGELPKIAPRDVVKERVHEGSVPGEVRGKAAAEGIDAVECNFRRLSTEEIRQLREEVTTGRPFRRFFLIGYVIYDDFFGFRYTNRFCVKTRDHDWQAFKGGPAYNSLKREKTPKEELIET